MPLLQQVAGRDRGTIAREVRTWSNHEGSILSWCRILSFYGFLLCYRGRPKSHNVSKRVGHRETLFYSFLSNFVKNSILSLPRYEQKSGAQPQLYTPFVLRTLVDSELRSRRNRTFDGPALFYAPLYPERKMSFAPMGARRSRGSREGKRTHPLLHLARDDKERASFIDEQRIDGALGIAFFFSPFLSASSDPLFEISSFVPNRLQNQILFHKILYQLYILLAFMPETSPVLWALAYVDQK
ncbi:UNVERIFIED_CONTAM: putative cytochrome c biosynthesis protein [Sesamum calycinum]|uniref:Cytochrome c biosynthesis protein n=1 Tax=Sesamum calycinum TaxID=2727403 RepID=A0AAW2JHY6_9LAMI